MSSDRSQPLVIAEDRQDEVVLDADTWIRLAQQALVHEGVVGAVEMGLAFVSVAEMTELNVEYMDGDGPTDVLAFPIDEDEMLSPTGPVEGSAAAPAMAGDVIICPAVAAKATNTGRGVEDEVALLVVHGVLHLLGHDHAEPEERSIMQAREQLILKQFHPTGVR